MSDDKIFSLIGKKITQIRCVGQGGETVHHFNPPMEVTNNIVPTFTLSEIQPLLLRLEEAIPWLKEGAKAHRWNGNFMKTALQCEQSLINFQSLIKQKGE